MQRPKSKVPRWLLLIVSASMVVFGHNAWARDCPSLVSGYLFQVGDTLELGAEFRAFYFGLSVGEGLPTSVEGSRIFENNVFLALRPLIYWYPVDGLTIAFEHESRYRFKGWDENAVPGTDFAVPGLDHRPTVLFIEYETHGVTITTGLQPISFGTGALLDQRFMGLAVGFDHSLFSVQAFGGMTMRNLMRNAAHSMWMSYISDTNGWKFTSNNPIENIAAGLTFSIKSVRPFRLQGLYLYSNPSYVHQESHGFGVTFSGPLWRPYLSFVLEPVFLLQVEGMNFLPGVVAELRARFGTTQNSPQLTLGGASSFRNSGTLRFASVYENLSLGMIRRFNLYQGHTVFLRSSWQAIEYLGVFVDYYLNLEGEDETDELATGMTIRDELDFGLSLRINDLYRLKLAYVGINLAGDLSPSHGIYAELRILIGQQP